jgi:hypothetical protein
MSDLQKQHNEPLTLTANQGDPYLAKPEDFKIGNLLAESDPAHKEALKDSDAVAPR